MKYLTKFAAIAVVAVLSSPAAAATLFENASGADTAGGNSRFDAGGSAEIGAEDFVLGSNSIVDGFTFQAVTGPGTDLSGTTVTWGIRDNSGTTPGSTVFASGTSLAAVTDLGASTNPSLYVFSFDIDIADLALTAATYWLTLLVDAPNTGNQVYWQHTDLGNDNTAYSTDGGATWFQPYSTVGPNEVFSVYGSVTAVPLPASGMLLLVGLAGLAGIRRRSTS